MELPTSLGRPGKSRVTAQVLLRERKTHMRLCRAMARRSRLRPLCFLAPELVNEVCTFAAFALQVLPGDRQRVYRKYAELFMRKADAAIQAIRANDIKLLSIWERSLNEARFSFPTVRSVDLCGMAWDMVERHGHGHAYGERDADGDVRVGTGSQKGRERDAHIPVLSDGLWVHLLDFILRAQDDVAQKVLQDLGPRHVEVLTASRVLALVRCSYTRHMPGHSGRLVQTIMAVFPNLMFQRRQLGREDRFLRGLYNFLEEGGALDVPNHKKEVVQALMEMVSMRALACHGDTPTPKNTPKTTPRTVAFSPSDEKRESLPTDTPLASCESEEVSDFSWQGGGRSPPRNVGLKNGGKNGRKRKRREIGRDEERSESTGTSGATTGSDPPSKRQRTRLRRVQAQVKQRDEVIADLLRAQEALRRQLEERDEQIAELRFLVSRRAKGPGKDSPMKLSPRRFGRQG